MKIPVLLTVLLFAAGGALADAPAHGEKAQQVEKKAAKKKPPRKATQSMGAAPASPLTELDAPARQARIEQAYANWQALQR